ncbi:MAG: endolytic transglycosylase MltG [Armatimonadetes bacterium]|nr:MAG: endolytic transglycosylase MltG [Armatimonadota bacterium]
MTQTEHDAGPSARTKLLLIGGAVLGGIVVLFLLANGVARLVSGGGATVEAGQPVTVSVQPGSTATSIYRLLSDAGVVPYNDIEAATTQAQAESSLQPGTYNLETGMEAGEVLRLLLEGGTAPDSRTITIVEGWTVARIVSELANRTEFDISDFTEALSNGSVTSPLLAQAPIELDSLQRWEGLLYPAKYQIPEGSTAAMMLQTMADEMVVRFEGVDWTPLAGMDISRYEALIIGSLVEWEAGIDHDRPLIASVIHNRLAVPMRLQIDATVIYALGENPGRVLAEHLDIDSPYNTYKIDGLPPTPIGTVSQASLQAAINPASTEYLFYVLADKDGSHAFATTYEEHQENAAKAKRDGILP